MHPSLAEPAAPIPPTDRAVNAARLLTSFGACANAIDAAESAPTKVLPLATFPAAKPLTPLAEVEEESAQIGSRPCTTQART